MHLTQRRINLFVFGLLFAASLLGLVLYLLFEPNRVYMAITGAASLVFGLLLYAYRRGWEYARHVLVILIALIVPLTLPSAYLTVSTSYLLFLPTALALVLLNPWWVIGVALSQLVLVSVLAGFPNLYVNPIGLLIYSVLIGMMVLSRLAVDSAQQLARARGEAETARQEAEAARHEAEERAHEVEERAREQAQLLDLVASLEMPAIEIADRVLLSPLIGNLAEERLERVATYLLQQASLRRPERIVIDIAGVTTVDTGAAQGLLQIARALRLLGCPVTLSGISPEVATTLTRLKIDLDEIVTTRSPQEALRLHMEQRQLAVGEG